MVLSEPIPSRRSMNRPHRSSEEFTNNSLSPASSRGDPDTRNRDRDLSQAIGSVTSLADPSTATRVDGIISTTETRSTAPILARIRAKLARATRTRSGHIPTDVLELENTYRTLPLLIGCMVPISILLNVPSLTSPWAGLAELDPSTGELSVPVPVDIPRWMDIMVIAALVMAVICNVFVLSRFLERHVYQSVVLSVIAATAQDILSVGVIIPFCLKYPVSEGYIYLEGFWTMIASMIFSLLATVLMSIDFHTTPHFRLMGSGVTHKQRMLIAQAMFLCFYLALGALIFIWIEKWAFLDSLFFVMVTITTIGFGDRVPKTDGGIVFMVFYASGGIVLFAMVVNAIRYVILEDLHQQFAVRAKERKSQREARKQERKRQKALEKEQQQRIQAAIDHARQLGFLDSEESHGMAHEESRDTHHPPDHRSFLKRGADTVLRGDLLSSLFVRRHSEDSKTKTPPVVSSSTSPVIHADPDRDSQSPRIPSGTPLSNVSSVAIERKPEQGNKHDGTRLKGSDIDTFVDQDGPQAASSSHDNIHNDNPIATISDTEDAATAEAERSENIFRSWMRRIKQRILRIIRALARYAGLKHTITEEDNDGDPHLQISDPERRREAERRLAYEESMEEYRRRLRFSFAMFSCFWLIGAGIFRWTESWGYGRSIYFSFVAFSSIGYGDMVPLSEAGRAIFLAYCFFGIVTLTTLAALISELLSKSMRRHVVEAQLRRNEMLATHGGTRGEQNTTRIDVELEDGLDVNGEVPRGDDPERTQHLRNLARFNPSEDEVQLLDPDRSCEASLRNMIQASKDFSALIQNVSTSESTRSTSTSRGGQRAFSLPLAPPTTLTPAQIHALARQEILNELEQEEDEDSPNYQSPSIAKDIMASTTSIHRLSSPMSVSSARLPSMARKLLNLRGSPGRSSDRGETATFHGVGYHTPSPGSQIKITAWPKSGTESSTDSEAVSASSSTCMQPKKRSKLSHPLQVSTSPTTLAPIPTRQLWSHGHNQDDSITISAVHWQQLIECSQRFQTLTGSCTRTLERLQEWETNERKRHRRRCRMRARQSQILQQRRQRLDELCGSRGAVDDAIEDEEELEAFQDWDEEGSTEEYDSQESSDSDSDEDEAAVVHNGGRGGVGSERTGQGLRQSRVE